MRWVSRWCVGRALSARPLLGERDHVSDKSSIGKNSPNPQCVIVLYMYTGLVSFVSNYRTLLAIRISAHHKNDGGARIEESLHSMSRLSMILINVLRVKFYNPRGRAKGGRFDQCAVHKVILLRCVIKTFTRSHTSQYFPAPPLPHPGQKLERVAGARLESERKARGASPKNRLHNEKVNTI